MSDIFEKTGSHPFYERVRNPAAWVPTIDGYDDQPEEVRQRKLDSYLAIQDRMLVAWQTFEVSAEKNFLDSPTKPDTNNN